MNSPPQRRFQVGINAETLALAWARQEAAPHGAIVIVDHEISPRGRLGRLWPHPADRTAVLASVWRPSLDAASADLVWLAASLGLLSAARSLDGTRPLALWWPDGLVDAEDRWVGEVRAEVQLAPGRVTSAVVTARLDLAAMGEPDRDTVTTALIAGLGMGAGHLDGNDEQLCASYGDSCRLTGRRITARLLPRGAARGRARGVDGRGSLELVSTTGLVERVPVDSLDHIELSPQE